MIIYEEVEASRVANKRERLRTATYEDLDKACYKWFLNARHQNIPVSWPIFKVKALYFAKEFSIDKFQASNGWIGGRNDSMFHLERFLVCTVFIIHVYKALVLICQQTDFVL